MTSDNNVDIFTDKKPDSASAEGVRIADCVRFVVLHLNYKYK
jgi:hypothetical protein